MRIVYFGNNPRGVQCLEALSQAGFEIVAVVTHHGARDEGDGGCVLPIAEKLGVPTFTPRDANAGDFVSTIRGLKPDLLILAGYNPFLKKGLLSIPAKGAINLHGGLLPNYRGGSPINWQIINGETTGACAILYVDEGIDTGNIIKQEQYPIGPDETAGEITQKTLKIFPRLLVETLREIKEDRVKAVKQDASLGVYYCKRYPQDGRIFWREMTDLQIHNLVRGLNGPRLSGAFTSLNGKKIILWKTKRLSRTVKGTPGRIALKDEEGVIVATRKNALLLTEIKEEEGGPVIPARDFFKIRGWTFE